MNFENKMYFRKELFSLQLGTILTACFGRFPTPFPEICEGFPSIKFIFLLPVKRVSDIDNILIVGVIYSANFSIFITLNISPKRRCLFPPPSSNSSRVIAVVYRLTGWLGDSGRCNRSFSIWEESKLAYNSLADVVVAWMGFPREESLSQIWRGSSRADSNVRCMRSFLGGSRGTLQHVPHLAKFRILLSNTGTPALVFH